MPFTFSHPAASVPFARLGLPLSALVVGSMSPDFLYFLALETRPKFGHTVPGIFLFCLPVGLAVLWMFHRVLKRPLLDFLPHQWQRRFAPACVPFSFGPPRRFLMISLALVLGAATHVIWDGFTHTAGWAVELMPWLRTRFDVGLLESMAGYRIVQHLSTFGGAILLAWWTRRWTTRNAPAEVDPVLDPRTRLAVWMVIPVFALAAGIMNAQRFGWLGDPSWMVRQALVQGVVGVIVGVFVCTLVFALIWRRMAARRYTA